MAERTEAGASRFKTAKEQLHFVAEGGMCESGEVQCQIHDADPRASPGMLISCP